MEMATDTKLSDQTEQYEETASEEEMLEFYNRIRQQEYEKIAQHYDNFEKRLAEKKLRMEAKFGKSLVESKIPSYAFSPYENQYTELLREIEDNRETEEKENENMRKGEIDFFFDNDGNRAIPYFWEDHTFLDFIYQLPSTSADQTFGRYYTSPSSSITDVHALSYSREAAEMDNGMTISTDGSRLKETDKATTERSTETPEAMTNVKHMEPATAVKKASKKNPFRRLGKWIRQRFSCCRKVED